MTRSDGKDAYGDISKPLDTSRCIITITPPDATTPINDADLLGAIYCELIYIESAAFDAETLRDAVTAF